MQNFGLEVTVTVMQRGSLTYIHLAGTFEVWCCWVGWL